MKKAKFWVNLNVQLVLLELTGVSSITDVSHVTMQRTSVIELA
jgi:hypothetical protein